jgi:hypothetical protein
MGEENCAIVDTNVWLTAAGQHEAASLECQEACALFLYSLRDQHRRIVVDFDYAILKEYRRKLPESSEFRRLLNEMQKDPKRLLWIEITPAGSPEHARPGDWFAQIPCETAFEHFDPSDRKFLAVAFATAQTGISSEIVNATESDWCEILSEMKSHQIPFNDLCRVCDKLNKSAEGLRDRAVR